MFARSAAAGWRSRSSRRLPAAAAGRPPRRRDKARRTRPRKSGKHSTIRTCPSATQASSRARGTSALHSSQQIRRPRSTRTSRSSSTPIRPSRTNSTTPDAAPTEEETEIQSRANVVVYFPPSISPDGRRAIEAAFGFAPIKVSLPVLDRRASPVTRTPRWHSEPNCSACLRSRRVAEAAMPPLPLSPWHGRRRRPKQPRGHRVDRAVPPRTLGADYARARGRRDVCSAISAIRASKDPISRKPF